MAVILSTNVCVCVCSPVRTCVCVREYLCAFSLHCVFMDEDRKALHQRVELTDRKRLASSVAPNLVNAPEMIRITEPKFAFKTFSGTLQNTYTHIVDSYTT